MWRQFHYNEENHESSCEEAMDQFWVRIFYVWLLCKLDLLSPRALSGKFVSDVKLSRLMQFMQVGYSLSESFYGKNSRRVSTVTYLHK